MKPFRISASVSSGLPLTFVSSDSTVARIVGKDSIQVFKVGTSVITASQGGDNNFNPAASVQQVLTVTKNEQAILFNAITDRAGQDVINLLMTRQANNQ